MTGLCSLPVELWHKIFEFLHNADIKSFASTSPYLRSLAVPSLFSSIRIRLGRFADHSTLDGNPVTLGWDEDREEEVVGRSLGVLLRIAELDDGNLDLKSLVQELHIVVAEARHKMVFEKHHLCLALKNIANLRNFSWIGSSVPSVIATELASSCMNLQSLDVHGLDNKSAGTLSSLKDLRDIKIIDVRGSSAFFGVSDGDPYSAFGGILENNAKLLRKLCLGSTTFRANTTQIMNLAASLTDLAINGVEDLPELEGLLRHATALRSLTLLDVTSLAFLPCTVGSLPNLLDLKLGVDYLPDADDILEPANFKPDMYGLASSLLEFVLLHTDLRRFDFSLWPTRQYLSIDDAIEEQLSQESNISWLGYVLEAVCALRGVQALGISFPYLNEYGLLNALEKLSVDAHSIRTCTALRLGGLTDVQSDIVIGELRCCTFLALSNSRPNSFLIPKYPLPSIDELFFHHGLTDLEQVCLGGQMFDVESSLNIVEDGVTASPWRSERLRSRVEADFCSADAHWLMSYRTVSKQYEQTDTDTEMDVNDVIWTF